MAEPKDNSGATNKAREDALAGRFVVEKRNLRLGGDLASAQGRDDVVGADLGVFHPIIVADFQDQHAVRGLQERDGVGERPARLL